jgi:DNA primase
MPGITILVDMLESLKANPHLTTAALLERTRGTSAEAPLHKLAVQPLSLESNELKFELIGLIEQLQQQAKQERHAFLMAKGLRNLSPEERVEINSLTSQ